MDSLLEPVELNRETAQALDEIRSGAENALYGAASADAEEKVNNSVLPLIEGAGLPGLHVMHYRWYLRELARHWRTRRGRDLAFHLELCIRKWVNLGLEPRTLQFLICEAHQRLKAVNLERSHPPITPIAEDSSTVRNPNLCKSVESVDSPPGPSSAESAKSVDDTPAPASASSAVSAYDARMCQPMAGPRPPADSDTGIQESSTPGALR
jgi:hypothetical protein